MILHKTKKVAIFLIIAVLSTKNIFAQKKSNHSNEYFSLWGDCQIFKCTPLVDSILTGSAVLIYGTDLILDFGLKLNQIEFTGEILDKNNVNSFDRFFMQPYSKQIDITADILLITALSSPAVLFATQNISEWMTITTMYAETVLLTQGLKEISKLFINRARPYVYYEGFPEKDVYDDFDWNNSCPSGHSTMSFMSATFFSYVFFKYNPQSLWRYPVLIGSYALASTVAALRVTGGNHFFTDVMLGAILGSGIGFLVPWLHTLSIKNKDTRIEFIPDGITLKIKIP